MKIGQTENRQTKIQKAKIKQTNDKLTEFKKYRLYNTFPFVFDCYILFSASTFPRNRILGDSTVAEASA